MDDQRTGEDFERLSDFYLERANAASESEKRLAYLMLANRYIELAVDARSKSKVLH